ncbi:MAG: UvrD-helicase domain-containing protein [Parachlamydiales bacterium]|nr:UvrD-helicase domain-containing protein [Parachlamydiales bacterium]
MSSLLNIPQKTAVEHIHGPMLVIAGAGSGKTRVVTYRIAHLIHMGIMPEHILAVTFTNKAAEEMQERIFALTKISILACTFHSLGARILRESIAPLGFSPSFAIYDEDDSLKLLRDCLKELNIKENMLKNIKNEISRAKNNLQLPEECQTPIKTPFERAFSQTYPLYQKKLRDYNALDFDDLLLYPHILFERFPDIKKLYQNRFLFILVDEYQDTNYAQYILTKSLAALHHNIFVVGDPDQSIYSWRGAQYENILRFDKDFAKAQVIHLEQNYRSSGNILKAANTLIQNNENRHEKNLWSTSGPGEKIKLFFAQTEQDEARFIIEQIEQYHKAKKIPLQEIVIFYRTNAQSRVFEDILLSKKIPYTIYGGISFYQRKEIKDILSFLRLALSPTDVLSFKRTINIPKRGIGTTSLEKLLLWVSSENCSILHFIEKFITSPSPYSDQLGKKQIQGFSDYLRIMQEIQQTIYNEAKCTEILQKALSITEYYSYLKEDMATYEDRKENIEQLIAKTILFDEKETRSSLFHFLEELSLVSGVAQKDKGDALKLMTLHNGKGLEFPVVFIAGLEEDLFPHVNAKSSSFQLEEERRLCYVGMTRAKEHLCLTASASRLLWGGHHFLQPSRFLKELPQDLIDIVEKDPEPFLEDRREPSNSIEGEFEVGNHVLHTAFGHGKIVKTYHTSFGLTYDILFVGERIPRSLVAQYAHLSPLSKEER